MVEPVMISAHRFGAHSAGHGENTLEALAHTLRR